MQSREDSFWEHLEQNPDDWDTMLVFSDYLEEQERNPVLFLTLRWMVEHKRRPKKNEAGEWYWYRKENHHPPEGPLRQHSLPYVIFNNLGWSADYLDFQSAVKRLAVSLFLEEVSHVYDVLEIPW